MKPYRTVVILPFLVLLGCSGLQPESGSFLAPVSVAGGADYWLGQVNDTHGLPPSELQDVRLSWERDFRIKPDTGNRIKLALLLTFGDEPVRNTTKAGQILEGMDTTMLSPGDQELVRILEQYLETDLIIDKLSTRANRKNNRIKELEQQLRDLTSIEQTIQQRDKGVGE
jgi:hypothetical protein